MYRKLMRNTTMALGTLLLGSSLVMAGGLQGTVSAIDGKGMGTVHTSDGKDHQVKARKAGKLGRRSSAKPKITLWNVTRQRPEFCRSDHASP
jgi:preprotein translocase subunit YajC